MPTEPRPTPARPGHPAHPLAPRPLRRRLRPDPPTASRPAARRPPPDGPDRPGSALPLPVPPPRRPVEPAPRSLLRRRLRPALVPAALAVGLAAVALALGGGDARPDAAGATAAAPAVSSGVAVLRGEIAAMEAAGMPADHPKVQLLREDLATLEGAGATPVVPEPGVDVAGRLAAALTRDAEVDAASFDDGPVACEPLPGLLTAADVDGARCSSTLQADGGSLYVAERPDGTHHAVRFAPDGTVTPSP